MKQTAWIKALVWSFGKMAVRVAGTRVTGVAAGVAGLAEVPVAAVFLAGAEVAEVEAAGGVEGAGGEGAGVGSFTGITENKLILYADMARDFPLVARSGTMAPVIAGRYGTTHRWEVRIKGWPESG